MIPPGGWAWAAISEESDTYDFQVQKTFSPGPWPLFGTSLTPNALEALQVSPGWIQDQLRIRFSDLLHTDARVSTDLQPVFALRDTAGEPELMLMDSAGAAVHVLSSDDWSWRIPDEVFGPVPVGSDIDGDGQLDSAFISDSGGVIIDCSGGSRIELPNDDLPHLLRAAMGDIEGDGLADLVLLSESGNLLVIRNRGTVFTPLFQPYFRDPCNAFPMVPGTFVRPALTEVDGSLHLAVGTARKGIAFYSSPASGSPVSLEWTETAVIAEEGHYNLSPAAEGGSFIFSDRDGGLHRAFPEADSIVPLRIPPVPGTYAAVSLADLEGIHGLIAGTREGGVYFLQQDGNGETSSEWERLEELPPIPSGTPACWNSGLLFGSRDGGLQFYRPDGDGTLIADSTSWGLSTIDLGDFSSPAAFDIDGDGMEEVIAGNAEGELVCLQMHDSVSTRGPLLLETCSWQFSPGGAVNSLDAYYGRYYAPYTVLRIPVNMEAVDACAGQILEAPPDLRDEIAYAMAHSPTGVIMDMYRNGDLDIFTLNALKLREAAELLPYAELVNGEDGTVCRIRTGEGWRTIPREAYYRFTVHPRILFETPAGIRTDFWEEEMDSTRFTYEEWLNHEPESLYGSTSEHGFWRPFFLERRELMESLSQARTYEEAVLRICNYQSHSQPLGHMSFGYSTNDLQPLVIHGKAYGSCGEQSILQTALCRTFLIPSCVVGCRGEDHQWIHYLDPDDGGWEHWDVNYGISGISSPWISGESIDHSGKTISTVTAFGPDNTVWPVTESVKVPPGSGYMPGDSGYTATAEVRVVVTDPGDAPVEGAMVLARSHWENANAVSEFNYTDNHGQCVFKLGWEPLGGYTFDVVSPYGTGGSRSISFEEGHEYVIHYRLPATVPEPQSIILQEDTHRHSIEVFAQSFPVSFFSRSLYSIDGADSLRSRSWTSWPGDREEDNVLFMDSDNFRAYRAGLHCRALALPFTPDSGDTCFAVIDNRGSMFHWKMWMCDFQADEELPAEEAMAFLSREVPVREPEAVLIGHPFENSREALSASTGEYTVTQDDPQDPLSSQLVIGPLMIPPGERSFSVASESSAPGLDVDLFLFRDGNDNRRVDGMHELVESSTSPSASELISLLSPEPREVYWIYVHGWSVPEGEAVLNLAVTPETEELPVSDIFPVGCISMEEDIYSFALRGYIASVDSILIDGFPVNFRLQDGRCAVPGFTADGARRMVQLFAGHAEPADSFVWTVLMDSVPPMVLDHEALLDTVSMEMMVSLSAEDAGSGVEEVSILAGGEVMGTLVIGEDSLWTGRVPLAGHGGQVPELEIRDMAGNSSRLPMNVIVPDDLPFTFSHTSPAGDSPHIRPYIQIYAAAADSSCDWVPEMQLHGPDGEVELDLMVRQGGLMQYVPVEVLEPGDYTAELQITDSTGTQAAERAWTFTVPSP